MKISINSATTKQLREFAELRHGIALVGQPKVESIIAKLRTVGFMGDEIEVDNDNSGTEKSAFHAGPQDVSSVSEPLQDQYFTIIVHRQEHDGGSDPITLQHNGTRFVIPRAEPCDVPAKYVSLMQDAVQRKWHQEKGTNKLLSQQVPTVNFSIVKGPFTRSVVG